MKYAILVYETDADFSNRTNPETQQEYWAGYQAYTQMLSQKTTGGAALQDVDTATTIRTQDDGQTVIQDGPFAETRERLGGFYIIEAENLDEAIMLGKQCPSVKNSCVEIRPLLEMG